MKTQNIYTYETAKEVVDAFIGKETNLMTPPPNAFLVFDGTFVHVSGLEEDNDIFEIKNVTSWDIVEEMAKKLKIGLHIT